MLNYFIDILKESSVSYIGNMMIMIIAFVLYSRGGSKDYENKSLEIIMVW